MAPMTYLFKLQIQKSISKMVDFFIILKGKDGDINVNFSDFYKKS